MPPCPCNKTSRYMEHAGQPITSDAGPATSKIGGYTLVAYPDCDELYTGADGGTPIYIVARGTDREKLFLAEDVGEAGSYGRRVNGTITRVPARSLCDAAVRDLKAGVGPSSE